MSFLPSYVKLANSGELQKRAERMREILKSCRLCPRKCGANRIEGETGICGATDRLKVSSAFAHFGEEPPLVGFYGSGTIFLTHCNLRCAFCQNHDISHGGQGGENTFITEERMADQILGLQAQGCHNINFVTPTHFAPQIVSAVGIAANAGLELPIVWNCGGYESLDVIKLLDGIVDIYMPDIKFFNADSAKKYCDAGDYPEVAKEAVKEMHRQVGDLSMDSRGIAQRGLLVRHLVMPNDVADTEEILRFLAEEISKNTYVNIMEQYRPLYHAFNFEEINRRITSEEFNAAVRKASELGLHSGF